MPLSVTSDKETKRMPRPRLSCCALAALFLLPRAVSADEAYFMVVFGAERPIYFDANHTHTWATFVRACPDADGCLHVVDAFTISWMPRTLEVRAGKLHPECGVNLDRYTSLNWAFSDGLRVSRYGPFRIERQLYDRAVV
jgi:hypothetical protein